MALPSWQVNAVDVTGKAATTLETSSHHAKKVFAADASDSRMGGIIKAQETTVVAVLAMLMITSPSGVSDATNLPCWMTHLVKGSAL